MPDVTKVKPAFSVRAKDLMKEYDRDKKATNAKYKDKVIEVTGVVVSFGKTFEGRDFINLGSPGSTEGVQCFTKEKKPWRKAFPSQTARVKGKYHVMEVGSFGLLGAVIQSVKGKRPPTLTARKLAEEYAADSSGTEKKFNERYLILTGEVAKVEADGSAKRVTLKTGLKTRVQCRFEDSQEEETKALKAGQKVKVFGQFYQDIFGEQKNTTGMNFCFLLD
jgi:hypothetical protein